MKNLWFIAILFLAIPCAMQGMDNENIDAHEEKQSEIISSVTASNQKKYLEINDDDEDAFAPQLTKSLKYKYTKEIIDWTDKAIINIHNSNLKDPYLPRNRICWLLCCCWQCPTYQEKNQQRKIAERIEGEALLNLASKALDVIERIERLEI